jgi:hypothetical protein
MPKLWQNVRGFNEMLKLNAQKPTLSVKKLQLADSALQRVDPSKAEADKNSNLNSQNKDSNQSRASSQNRASSLNSRSNLQVLLQQLQLPVVLPRLVVMLEALQVPVVLPRLVVILEALQVPMLLPVVMPEGRLVLTLPLVKRLTRPNNVPTKRLTCRMFGGLEFSLQRID